MAMENLSYQKIADYLQDMLPVDWSRLFFVTIFVDRSYSCKCYADLGDGTFTDCFRLPMVTKALRDIAFSGIYAELQAARAQLPEDARWSGFVMQLSSTGKFKAGFDYGSEDIPAADRIEALREKYANA